MLYIFCDGRNSSVQFRSRGVLLYVCVCVCVCVSASVCITWLRVSVSVSIWSFAERIQEWTFEMQIFGVVDFSLNSSRPSMFMNNNKNYLKANTKRNQIQQQNIRLSFAHVKNWHHTDEGRKNAVVRTKPGDTDWISRKTKPEHPNKFKNCNRFSIFQWYMVEDRLEDLLAS